MVYDSTIPKISHPGKNALLHNNPQSFFRPIIQPKLTINQPNDVYEQEADAMAERVMRMTDSSFNPHGFFQPSVSSIQRKCDHCEEEEKKLQRKCEHCEEEEKKLQRKEDNSEVLTETSSAENYIKGIRGKGSPLTAGERKFFQPRFGYDFSQVQLHTDAEANKSAKEINALAYTYENNIVFGPGQYKSGGDSGKLLMAHELTHVVQQNTGTIRRAAFDYEINELPADAAGDASRIFFERGSTAIPASESSKITALATPASRNLTLHGFESEETAAATRATTVNTRLNEVETALVNAGHTATRARVAHPDEGVGDIEYRNRRSVEVLPTPIGLLSAPTSVNPCGVAGSENMQGAELTACETSFTEALSTLTPNALDIVNSAEKDIVTTPTVAATAIVNQFFQGVPRAAVNKNIKAIAKQVRQLPARHRCHTGCDGGCGRPAYNTGTGLGASGAMMTICPDFVSASLDFRVEVLIHESSHANPRESIKDIAYSNTRLIPFLLPADARRNTDSYVLLMRLVHTAGSMQVGPSSPDVLTGMTATGAGSDTEISQRAIAWLESWLNYGDFDTEILYSTIVASIAAGRWVTTGPHEFNIETMHRLARIFTPDLTDPGRDGRRRRGAPTEQDKVHIAAIHDRFDQMYSVVNQSVLNITRAPVGGTESWGSLAGIPHLSQNVTVLPSFFTLSPVDQVKKLVSLMMRARTDVSAAFEPKYVDALDKIHTHRKLGP